MIPTGAVAASLVAVAGGAIAVLAGLAGVAFDRERAV